MLESADKIYTQQSTLGSRFLTHSAVNRSDFNEIWNQADFQDVPSDLNFLNKLTVVTLEWLHRQAEEMVIGRGFKEKLERKLSQEDCT